MKRRDTEVFNANCQMAQASICNCKPLSPLSLCKGPCQSCQSYVCIYFGLCPHDKGWFSINDASNKSRICEKGKREFTAMLQSACIMYRHLANWKVKLEKIKIELLWQFLNWPPLMVLGRLVKSRIPDLWKNLQVFVLKKKNSSFRGNLNFLTNT